MADDLVALAVEQVDDSALPLAEADPLGKQVEVARGVAVKLDALLLQPRFQLGELTVGSLVVLHGEEAVVVDVMFQSLVGVEQPSG